VDLSWMPAATVIAAAATIAAMIVTIRISFT
jgi:hypothetical protein